MGKRSFMSTFTFICLQGQLGATFSLLYRAPSCESIRKYWLRLVKYGKVWLYIYTVRTVFIYIYMVSRVFPGALERDCNTLYVFLKTSFHLLRNMVLCGQLIAYRLRQGGGDCSYIWRVHVVKAIGQNRVKQSFVVYCLLSHSQRKTRYIKHSKSFQ